MDRRCRVAVGWDAGEESKTDREHFLVRFEDVSIAEAGRFAEDLRGELLDADSSIEVERNRDDPSSQDFGATLVLVLGAPAVVVAAQALKRWLERNNAVSVTLATESGLIVAKNLESKDVPAIVEALSRSKRAR